MNQKGWADYLMMIAGLVKPQMSWDEQQAKAASVKAARTLYENWEKMQEEIDQSDAPAPSIVLHLGDLYTAEERTISRRQNQSQLWRREKPHK